MTLLTPRKPFLWIWFLWLGAFYATWCWLAFGRGLWPEAVAHWPMALSMTFGSYIAGSTPMGGGTVGFPILVLLFDMPATLGRDFSFAVQSIGMTSASIFILARRQPLAWAMLKGALLGATAGLPLGIFLVAPLVPELWIKLVFAVIWASFGVLHLYRIGEIAGRAGMTDFDERWDFRVGVVIGFAAAALVAAVTGVGIDMVLYAALVLLCRADLRIAIPTSVLIMAWTSVLGIAIKSVSTGVAPGVFGNWLAAAPVVALGAPLGALVVNLIGRRPTLVFVALLCVGQFAWTCRTEWAALGWGGLLLALAAVGLCLLGFERLRRWGALLAAGRDAAGARVEHRHAAARAPDGVAAPAPPLARGRRA
ncbi:sulfite exporter TauE/SafE family protein [Coralloluteibacterium stylophorae]|uniref:Probable membrane transporter protein n=1 Tax=Coralloluteibacterium stylophorae TaxID=1776034 RepID=A0A8J7VQB8_9GAMM|nr:sulfite exporter TauE/SafE family protein [Coralloluteibacterium stylophorae]MBS7456918.1 sulfite exporter TauE/SafE family protein [Coralloluteibacterium stylophorae]